MMISDAGMVRVAGLVALVAAVGGVTADLATFYTPTADSLEAVMPLVDLQYLLPHVLMKPAWQTHLGHYLALMVIPTGVLGLYPIYRSLKPAGYYLAEIVALLGVLGYTAGSAFHLSFGYVIAVLREAHGTEVIPEILSRFEPLVLSTAFYAFGLMMVSFGMLLVVTLMGRTAYPRWSALLNPVITLIILHSLALVVPVSVGILLMMTALNVPLVIFYTATVLFFWHEPLPPAS